MLDKISFDRSLRRSSLACFAVCAALIVGQPASASITEAAIQALLNRGSGRVDLPAGIIEITRGLTIPPHAHDVAIVGAPAGTVLQAAPNWNGKALLAVDNAARITIQDLQLVGNQKERPLVIGLPPGDMPFSEFYPRNGIVARRVNGLHIQSLHLSHISTLAIAVNEGRQVLIEDITVDQSGCLNQAGANNTTGGVLLEEGTIGFTVRHSKFTAISGNAIWTHSWQRAPRNGQGLIADNQFGQIGRDAIQIGHATGVAVQHNHGDHIGYPAEVVDAAGGGTPVGIDTAGNVDKSIYSDNAFTEVDGKCIDLDGFHDGTVLRNQCHNAGQAGAYPYGHFGIVFNNTNPGMQSELILVKDNVITGMRFGGIFVVGRNNTIEGNRFTRLNLAHCNENAALQCIYFPNEPDLLRSGIYLGTHAERPDPAAGNVIRNNVIEGYKMGTYCLGFSPGVSRQQRLIAENQCSDR